MARTKSFDQTEVLIKIQQLFMMKGFNGTSVDDLVAASGLSRSSLYDTFGDKESLFYLSLVHYRKHSTDTMIDTIRGSTNIRKTLSELFEFIRNDAIANRRLGCMMVNTAVEVAPHERKISRNIAENMEALQIAMTDAIAKAQLKGEVSKDYSAESLSVLILTSINGLRVAEKWGADQKVYRQIKDLILNLL